MNPFFLRVLGYTNIFMARSDMKLTESEKEKIQKMSQIPDIKSDEEYRKDRLKRKLERDDTKEYENKEDMQ